MNTLTKPPLILKVLWFIPFALLLIMVSTVEWPPQGPYARQALVTLAMATLFFLVAAAAGTVLWLRQDPTRQRS